MMLLSFILGAMFGGTVDVVVMALLQVSGRE